MEEVNPAPCRRGKEPMSLAHTHERLDEMCARVQREAASAADRIITEMDTFDELSIAEQRRTGYTRTHKTFSQWEIRRVLLPAALRELNAA